MTEKKEQKYLVLGAIVGVTATMVYDLVKDVASCVWLYMPGCYPGLIIVSSGIVTIFVIAGWLAVYSRIRNKIGEKN